jgi:DNA-binding MarR family transcriptional regulator
MSKEAENWIWNNSLTNGNDRLVLLYLADQASDDGTNSFPSIQTLAQKCNVDKDTVRRVLNRLEAAGEILIERPEHQGRGWFNRYTLVLGRPVELVRELADKARDLRPFAGRTPQTRNRGTDRHQPGETSSGKVAESGVRAAQLGVIPIDPLKNQGVSPQDSLEAAMERFDTEFWPVYPRHEDKFGASRAWSKAIRIVEPEVIIAGARRYRDDPNRLAAYTKHPATWLNHQCWDDEPLPSRTGAPRVSGAEVLLNEMRESQ